MKDVKLLVKSGYDNLGNQYREHFEKEKNIHYQKWLGIIKNSIQPGNRIIELGCADGIPTAKFLSQYYQYLGIDISSKQIEIAKNNVPNGDFIEADMSNLEFPNNEFSGIIALYSIIHLPISEQPNLLRSIYSWLKPRGIFMCILGAESWTGTEEDWIKPGVKMYWSHEDANTYKKWFEELGFILLESYIVPEGNLGHTFFLLKKP